MIDSREVKHSAQNAHGTHPRNSHALWPWVCNEKSVEQEVTLSRVKVDILNRSGGTLEDQRTSIMIHDQPVHALLAGRY